MAVLALALAGSAIGAAVGGTILGVSAATIGFVAGEVAGNLLFPQKQTSEGPRVGDLSVQSSTYGSAIPIIYGTMRVAGNVIFSTPKREVKNEQTSGGKGGPKITTTTYTYNVDMAIALCEGPIDGIRKMWLNGKLVYDASTGASITSSVASSIHAEGWNVYLGDEAQLPDPTIETTVGVGNVPGYRGMAYIVFDHLDCPNGQVPQLSFEIVASGTSGPSSITFEEVPAPDAPLFALASIVGNRVWQFVGDNGAQPVYSAGPDFYSNEGVRLFSTATGGDQAPISVQGGPYGLFHSFAPGPSYTTPLSLIAVNLETGDTSIPLVYIPGVSSNSLAPARAAYDPISGDFCAVNGSNSLLDPRSASITIFSSNTLTDVLMTPSTPMAFYNSVIYTCGTSAGETFLNSYDTTGALIDSVGAGQDCGFAGNLIVHASANGVYVVQGGTGTTSLDRSVWKITGGAWVLLCATANYDNGADNAWTYWTNDFYGIFGPSSASGGNVTYTTVRYTAFDSNDVPVGDIIEAVCERAGLDVSQIDTSDCTDTVHGFAISQVAPARNTIDPLVRTFFVDAIETDGALKFRRRAGKSVIASIPYDDLGTNAGDQAIDPFPMARTQEAELPRSVALTYYNWASDYQPGTEMARRQVTSSVNDLTDQLPIATSPDQMATAAATLLYDAWALRTTRATALPRSYAYLDVGDNVSVEYPRGTYTNKRLTKITDTGQLMQVEMVDSDPSVYSLTIPGATSANPQTGVEYVPPTRMVLLDIPILRDADDNAGLYGVFSGYSSDWRGALLYRSDASGVFASAGSITTSSIQGTSVTALGDWTNNMVDEKNTVDVQVISGTLSSITRDQMLTTEANAILLGDEILQFATATSLGGGQYRLSELRRHMRGTDWATADHAAGERFVVLQTDGTARFLMSVSEVNVAREYEATSIGSPESTTITFTNTANGLKPLSVANLELAQDGGVVYARWVRRTRYAENWLAGAVPLGETSESYEIDVTYGDTTTTYTATSPSFTVALSGVYSSATLAVYQMGTLGRGYGVSATVPVNAPRWVDGTVVPLGLAGSKVLAQKFVSGDYHVYESADDGISFTSLGVTPRLTAYPGYRALRSDGVYVSILGESIPDPTVSSVSIVHGIAGNLPTTTGTSFARGGMPASVACDGTTFLVITEGNHIFTSTDGASWTNIGSASLPITLTGSVTSAGFASNYFGNALLYAGGRWFLTIAGALYYTADATALTGWTACVVPSGVSTSGTFNIAEFGGTLYISATYKSADDVPSAAVVMKSSDSGSTWTFAQSAMPQPMADLFDVAGSLIAVRYDYAASCLVSRDGSSWQPIPNGLVFVNRVYPVSTGARLIVDGMRWSTDGASFTASTGI
jgi:hypothetical protein